MEDQVPWVSSKESNQFWIQNIKQSYFLSVIGIAGDFGMKGDMGSVIFIFDDHINNNTGDPGQPGYPGFDGKKGFPGYDVYLLHT